MHGKPIERMIPTKDQDAWADGDIPAHGHSRGKGIRLEALSVTVGSDLDPKTSAHDFPGRLRKKGTTLEIKGKAKGEALKPRKCRSSEQQLRKHTLAQFGGGTWRVWTQRCRAEQSAKLGSGLRSWAKAVDQGQIINLAFFPAIIVGMLCCPHRHLTAGIWVLQHFNDPSRQ